MSRSIKKTLGFTDNNHSHQMKKLASRRFRRCKTSWYIPSGMAYRKHTESWDIRDWSHMEYSLAALKTKLEQDYDSFRDSRSRWWGVRSNESKAQYIARKVAKYKMK